MMKILLTLSFLLLISVLVAQEKTEDKAYWKNGTNIESGDGNFKIKFGGRMQYDLAAFDEDDEIKNTIGESKNGFEFRRVRLFSAGQIYKNVKYKVQLDFAGGKVGFKDVFMTLTKFPVLGNIQMGHFKEPVGLEEITSSKYLTFMERSLTGTSIPSRNTGFMIYNSILDKKLTYYIGTFKDVGGDGNSLDAQDKYNVSMRLIGTPINSSADNRLLHIGASTSIRNLQGDTKKLSNRPEAHISNKYVSTGSITNIEKNILVGGELLFISGPFSLQGEYFYDKYNREESFEDVAFSSYYASVSYFLTGESKKYKSNGSVNRLSPKRNFGQGIGPGAWELALRFSSVDLNNGDIEGGKLNDITFAVNWYLNPATRIMMNYINADLADVGRSNIFQMRFQIDF